MNIKTLNLPADKLNKKIKSLSQFKDFYKDMECLDNFKITKINSHEFKKIYKKNFEKILIIDVRENEEFNKFSLSGTISIPLKNLEQKSYLEFIKQESEVKEVFTLCQLGKRSETASKILMKFKIPSKSIEGGIEKIKNIKLK